jgi:hypothetical protein
MNISIFLYLLIVIKIIENPIELNDANIFGFQITPLYLPEKKSKLKIKQINTKTNSNIERCLKKLDL